MDDLRRHLNTGCLEGRLRPLDECLGRLRVPYVDEPVDVASALSSIVCVGPVNQFFTDTCQYTHSASMAAGTTRMV